MDVADVSPVKLIQLVGNVLDVSPWNELFRILFVADAIRNALAAAVARPWLVLLVVVRRTVSGVHVLTLLPRSAWGAQRRYVKSIPVDVLKLNVSRGRICAVWGLFVAETTAVYRAG
ncbi:hypothetical protein GCM10008957_31960 [Deinococcus ruber]|uniref:Uncharacterized protein n=1 Tax=Deinococcus ruber TaxID=1848197 RepID=A0A918CBJ2_9DEIO|nr:hypothetical protein GCM10008957_31960 [Deinococcus ruber]